MDNFQLSSIAYPPASNKGGFPTIALAGFL